MRPVLLVLLAACAPDDAPAPEASPAPGDVADTGAGGDAPAPEAPRPDLPRLRPVVDADPADGVFGATLTAAAATRTVGDAQVQGYAYSGDLIRTEVGDRVEVLLDNQLDTPTTLHWHGVGAPYAMDGVPWQRAPTSPGGSFLYAFDTASSGTFWFHPHFDTARQVDLGLYGVIVVDDPADPPVDEDLVLVLDAWGESGDDAHAHLGDPAALTWTVNGAVDPVGAVAGGVVRLRLLNASNTGYLALDTSAAQVLALDQGVRTAPWTTPTLVLGPGDRAELLLTLNGPWDLVTAPYSLNGGASVGDPIRLATLTPGGAGAAAAPSFSAPARAPSSDPGHTTVSYTLQGDPGTDAWRINHEAFPDVTIREVDLGEDVIVEVRNLSPTHHPFHGHGHAFEVLSIDGVPPPRRTIEDTIDVPLYGVVRLRYTATRPGDWMQHCHILPHADGGMMTVLRVVDGAAAR